MEKVLWPYGHRASGQGPVSDTVRQAMNTKHEEHNDITPEKESVWSNSSDDIDDTRRLLKPKKPIKGRHYYDDRPAVVLFNHERLRPYWLGLGLCLTLFSFWVLDSLKDPVFAILVDGNLDQHQPPAKLVSVGTTLILVCSMEFLAHFRKRRNKNEVSSVTQEQVMDGGGTWTRMSMDTVADQQQSQSNSDNDSVSIHMFTHVGGCYALLFVLMAYVLQFHPGLIESSSGQPSSSLSHSSTAWHVLAYALYATIESFGSLSVATFWSFTNSTLCLEDAERFYGPIIAMAQLGAIAGSTMVTTHYWSFFPLFLVASLVICLQILVISCYNKRYRPTNTQDEPPISTPSEQVQEPTHTNSPLPASCGPDWSILFSGVQLILKHNYVLLILGVSCLYEVSLTCLDYQMKLIGWNRFEQDEVTSLTSMSFTQFMGHYGQVTNVTSLFFSYVCFPYLIKTLGLRYTVRLFPTLLVFATVVAYGAIPGNLAVLFLSMSILKAMTYSIHDPAKEILYLPTSNAIKFRAKFWIDVVGARIAKAAGSTINTYAGSVDRIVRYGSIPSLLTACALWLVCYRAGIQFDNLVQDGVVVGHEEEHEADSQELVKTDYQYVVYYRDEEEQQDGEKNKLADEESNRTARQEEEEEEEASSS